LALTDKKSHQTRDMPMDIRPFHPDDQAAVIALWQACELTRPWNNPELDITRKLSTQPELFLVGTQNGLVIATAMAGYDGHRGWVNYLAVAPTQQKRAYGKAIMAEVEQRLAARGCPKLNLQVRGSNAAALGFYAALGYGLDDVVSLGKRLIVD
jgi:ribosomal protein S18 acetylase RimI-like enzyme